MLPEEFHELGKTLLENHSTLCKDGNCGALLTSECIYRALIDRFYYSAFLSAREWLKQNNSWHEVSDNDHENVRMSIKKCKTLKGGTTLAGLINRLRKERNAASY